MTIADVSFTTRKPLGKTTGKGFTLIELLVVIAIIAILAAILFPVFASAREKARQTTCMNNMKQLGMGIMQYIQDYDETPPNGSANGGPVHQWGTGWAGQILYYVKAANVFQCPDDPTTATPGYSGYVSYAMNDNMGVNPKPTPGPTGYSYPISKFTAPASTVFLCEIQGAADINLSLADTGSPVTYGIGESWDPEGGGDISSCPPSSSGTLVLATGWLAGRYPPAENIYGTIYNYGCYFTGQAGRHNAGAIYLMADGHAKWLLPSTVSGGYNALTINGVQAATTAAGTGGTVNGSRVAATFSII